MKTGCRHSSWYSCTSVFIEKKSMSQELVLRPSSMSSVGTIWIDVVYGNDILLFRFWRTNLCLIKIGLYWRKKLITFQNTLAQILCTLMFRKTHHYWIWYLPLWRIQHCGMGLESIDWMIGKLVNVLPHSEYLDSTFSTFPSIHTHETTLTIFLFQKIMCYSFGGRNSNELHFNLK